MSKTAPGIFILRTFAIVVALAALTAYVVVRSRSAGQEKQRTRASSSKSQTISASVHAWLAGTEIKAEPGPPADFESVFGAGFKTKYQPEKDGTHFPGTKSGLLLSPSELSALWPALESLHIPKPGEPLPPALQTTDSPR